MWCLDAQCVFKNLPCTFSNGTFLNSYGSPQMNAGFDIVKIWFNWINSYKTSRKKERKQVKSGWQELSTLFDSTTSHTRHEIPVPRKTKCKQTQVITNTMFVIQICKRQCLIIQLTLKSKFWKDKNKKT